MTCQSAIKPTLTPWYLEPDALALIARIAKRPPTETRGDVLGRKADGRAIYVGPSAASLQAYWMRRFREIDAIRPWPAETMDAVVMSADDQDVLVALFGPAEGYRAAWHDEARERRIRDAIRAGLAAQAVAA